MFRQHPLLPDLDVARLRLMIKNREREAVCPCTRAGIRIEFCPLLRERKRMDYFSTLRRAP
jgi:hypothetical protein